MFRCFAEVRPFAEAGARAYPRDCSAADLLDSLELIVARELVQVPRASDMGNPVRRKQLVLTSFFPGARFYLQ